MLLKDADFLIYLRTLPGKMAHRSNVDGVAVTDETDPDALSRLQHVVDGLLLLGEQRSIVGRKAATRSKRDNKVAQRAIINELLTTYRARKPNTSHLQAARDMFKDVNQSLKAQELPQISLRTLRQAISVKIRVPRA